MEFVPECTFAELAVSTVAQLQFCQPFTKASS
jgi:hypothetical protein